MFTLPGYRNQCHYFAGAFTERTGATGAFAPWALHKIIRVQDTWLLSSRSPLPGAGLWNWRNWPVLGINALHLPPRLPQHPPALSVGADDALPIGPADPADLDMALRPGQPDANSSVELPAHGALIRLKKDEPIGIDVGILWHHCPPHRLTFTNTCSNPRE